MPGLLDTPQAEQGATPPAEVKQSAGEEAAQGKERTKNDAPASRAVVGIIYPPPDVRNIVDKTADFVARNGPEFEERIKLNEAGNTRFNFLNRLDPYHAYYQHKIQEIREGVAQERMAAQQPGYIPPPKQAPVTMVLESEVPRDPPPEFEFVVEPPSISAMELDIVKLTSQFVARNGAAFLDKLMMREQRNYQFDFLRKQHPLFHYFTKLVEQYSKILLPAYNTLPNLRQDIENPAKILDKSQHRMLWEQYQKKQRQRAEEEEEKKRVEYAQIDWHDFVIVETINFRENEAGYLPPPIRPTQLAQRLLQQSKFDRLAEEGGEVQEIEMEVEEQDQPSEQPTPTTGAGDKRGDKSKDGPRPPSKPPGPPPQKPPPPGSTPTQPKGPVQVRRDYNPKAAQAQAGQSTSTQYLISPITGEKIPADKMEEHMRYGLQDPRYTEEKKKQIAEKKTQEEVFAEGVQIGSNLKLLAERRTDIFGVEETIIGQKIGEEEAAAKPPSVQWDGHSGSADTITREAQANIGEQLKAIQKAKEQAEKEQLGPALLKTPINAAPPAHPPTSAPPQRPPLPQAPPRSARPPPPQRPLGEARPLLQMGPPHMQPPRPMMPPQGMMPLPNSAPPLHGMPPQHMQPPPFMHMHPMQAGFPGGPMGGAPPPKRPHMEDDLVPEQEFINAHPGPVMFKVQVPNFPERSEWKLHGQVLSITLPITDPVSVIKAKISDELGMPSGKQKLQIGSSSTAVSLTPGALPAANGSLKSNKAALSSSSVANVTVPSSSSSSSPSSLKPQHLDTLSATTKPSTTPSSSASSTQRPALSAAEPARTGGGRHPHPPSGNNTKLKHKCPFDGCPWRFATPYKLRRHIKSHTKETPYLCKECGRGFSVRYNLLMHIQTIHSQPQKFKCPIRGCKDAFHSQSRLNGHLRRIHKKDWKSLQSSKDCEVKNVRGGLEKTASDLVDCTAMEDGAAPTSGARKARLPSAPYKCSHCDEEFSSKAKLTAHVKIHAPGKPYKCIVQGCGKSFAEEDKLLRHAEVHKSTKQFCCPHKNCNRIFLRQTHLRNHLKIHTQDHQFICPVLDCSQKFTSEGAYNVHLNTHINYGYTCHHPGCDHSFLTRKRLAIHMHVVHKMFTSETGIGSPQLLDGIQPHLGMAVPQSTGSLHSPSSSPPSLISLSHHHAHHHAHPRSCVLDEEFIKNVDLPGLAVDDIEAVLSENEDWSGEQIDQFLRSAVDLSEIESKLFSLAGYESDSGYSTYDVSPITSNAPANLGYSVKPHPSCPPPPPLNVISHTTSPLFSNTAFPPPPPQGISLPPPPHPSPSALIHDSAVSPCGSDAGFFSPHSGFSPMPNTPNHDSLAFFPPPPSTSLYSQNFSSNQPQHDFNGTSSVFSISPTHCGFPDITSAGPSFTLPIPDIILPDVHPSHHHHHHLPPCPVESAPPNVDFTMPQETLSEPSKPLEMAVNVSSPPDTSLVKTEECPSNENSPKSCSFEDLKPSQCQSASASSCAVAVSAQPLLASLVSVKVQPKSQSESHCAHVANNMGATETQQQQVFSIVPSCAFPTNGSTLPAPPPLTSSTGNSTNRKTKNGVSKSKASMKGQKKKTQWPRSMNRANLIAFREHILNKLKKAQDGGMEKPIPIQILANKTRSKSPSVKTGSSGKGGATTPTSAPANCISAGFEVQVSCVKNTVSPPKRCHSEPADLQSYQSATLASGNVATPSAHCQSSPDIQAGLRMAPLSAAHCPEEVKLILMESGDILSDLNFNPDTFLAPNIDDKILDNFDLKFNMENSEEDSEILDMFSESSSSKHAHCPSSSSLSEVETMDIDCIQGFLDDDDDLNDTKTSTFSPSASLGSGAIESSSPPTSCCTPTTLRGGLSRSNSLSSMGANSNSGKSQGESACESPRGIKSESRGSSCTGGRGEEREDDHTSFKFPEILSIHGSMVLDGVSVLSEGEIPPSSQNAFLQSHNDPLLADGHSGCTELFEF